MPLPAPAPTPASDSDAPSCAPAQHRPDIDGLRALAVLAVLLFHLDARALPGGYLGVDVFFVISGYVVSGALYERWHSHGARGFFTEFYAARLARIVPALSATVLLSFWLATLFIPQAWLSGLSDRTGLAAFYGLSNWVMMTNHDRYFAPQAEFNPYTQTWSLGVEAQFYLLMPWLIGLGLCARGRWARQALALLLALCAASLAWFVWASRQQPETAFYFAGCRFWELGLGVALRLAPAGLLARVPAARERAAWLGATALAACLTLGAAGPAAWAWHLVAVLGSALILGSGAGPAPRPRLLRGLARPLPVWLGRRSYSIYLWHWPVFVLLRWTLGLESADQYLLALALTLGLSLLSFALIEQPLRHPRRIEALPAWLRIAGFALLPWLGYQAAYSMLLQRQSLSWSQVSRQPQDWYATNTMPYEAPAQRNCQVDLATDPVGAGLRYVFKARDCRQPPARPGTLHVLGDSHAGAYRPMFEQLSADTGLSVSVYEFPACSFIDFITPITRSKAAGCLAFTEAAVSEVLARSGPGDLVFMPSLRMSRYGGQWANFHIRDMREHMYEGQGGSERPQALEDARQWLRRLADAPQGLRLVFEAPKPIFQAPTFRCVDSFNRHNPICVGANQQPRDELERLRAPIVQNMAGLAQDIPRLSVWDPFPILCPEPVCHALRDGRPLFFDSDHPSAYGNWLLYPDFRRHIEARRAEDATAPPQPAPASQTRP